MPDPLVLLFWSLLAIVAIYAGSALAKDVAVLFCAVGHLPIGPAYGTARSGKWKAFREKWLELHPDCAACGGTEQVEAHHKKPFHLQPELELDSHNIITLCEKRLCHLMLGHSGDWHAYNPHVADDAKFMAQANRAEEIRMSAVPFIALAGPAVRRRLDRFGRDQVDLRTYGRLEARLLSGLFRRGPPGPRLQHVLETVFALRKP